MSRRPRARQATARQRSKAASRQTFRARSSRSRAARKGWQTRRKAAQARSATARKGWAIKRARLIPRARTVAAPRVTRERVEYAVSADYKALRRGSSVSVQLSAIGPAGASRHDAQEAVAYAIDHKGHSPKGWDIRFIDWRGDKARDAWRRLRKPLEKATLTATSIR